MDLDASLVFPKHIPMETVGGTLKIRHKKNNANRIERFRQFGKGVEMIGRRGDLEGIPLDTQGS
jgi:hypothetical protein